MEILEMKSLVEGIEGVINSFKGILVDYEGDYKPLAQAITTYILDRIVLDEGEMGKTINEWLKHRHGINYNGVLARDLATAICSAKDKIIKKRIYKEI